MLVINDVNEVLWEVESPRCLYGDDIVLLLLTLPHNLHMKTHSQV